MTLVQSKLSQTLSPSSVLTNLGRHLTKPDRESLYPEDNPALLPLIPNWYHPPPPILSICQSFLSFLFTLPFLSIPSLLLLSVAWSFSCVSIRLCQTIFSFFSISFNLSSTTLLLPLSHKAYHTSNENLWETPWPRTTLKNAA